MTPTFDPAKATDMLTQRGLLTDASETLIAIKDPTRLLEDLNDLKVVLAARGEPALVLLVEDLMARSTTAVTTLSEPKIEDLVRRGKLSPTDVAACHTTKTTFALYETTTP